MQRKAALAVQHSVVGKTLIRSNVMFELNGTHHEYDTIVIHDCAATKTSTAYIVESARSPQPEDVAKLLQRTETYKMWAGTPNDKTVAKFVPVLGGRHISAETIRECIARNVLRVTLSGTDYETVCANHIKLFPSHLLNEH